ncbi:alkaline-phosphatase-like protein [Xylariales sp. PMI_506]|nr:alkaline-phosphatase-like protein [Xylariales sp. PMI_506]
MRKPPHQYACSAWRCLVGLLCLHHVAADALHWASDESQVVMSGAHTETSTSKKNILFIITDDQDLHMDSPTYMPFLKKHLIDRGTSFNNHFTTTSICCPSRVALWTGKQPHNTNVTDVNPPYGGYPKFISQGFNDNYLPVWLQQAGYETYYTGKLFNAHTIFNYDSPYPGGWTGTDFLLDPGTYAYLNPIYQRNKEPPVQHSDKHTSELIAEKALGFIDEASQSEKPFFIAVAPIAPHSNIDFPRKTAYMTEPIPLAKHQDLFKEVKIPRRENFNPNEPSGANWIRQLPQLNESTVEYLDHFYRQRLRALQAVDELVDQLVARLEGAGLLDDTYIIYTSDNGYHLGQHRLPPGKECAYEDDIRVPLYVRGPGVAAGVDEEAVTTHIDLAPTLLRIAGVDLSARADLDGAAIPLAGAATIRHEHVTVEYWGTAIAEGEVGGFGGNGQIVMPNNTYKAVRIVGHGYNLLYTVWCNNEHELYDLETDPYQMKNLYPAQDLSPLPKPELLLGFDIDSVVQRLDALLMVLKSCKGRVCVDPWATLHPAGDVHTLVEAMSARFSRFYEEQIRVEYTRCEAGYIIDAEGPQVGYQYREAGSGSEEEAGMMMMPMWPHWT